MRGGCAAAAGTVVLAALTTSGSVSRSVADSAPTVSTPRPCWIVKPSESSQAFPVQGSGFAAGSWINVEVNRGAAYVEVQADGSGSFSVELPISGARISSPVPTRLTLGAYSTSTAVPTPPPTLLASTSVPAVVRGGKLMVPFGSVRRAVGIFVGGAPSATIYAHYFWLAHGTYQHRFAGTSRIGRTTGPCGALSAKRQLFRHIRPVHTSPTTYWDVDFSSLRQPDRYSDAVVFGDCLFTWRDHAARGDSSDRAVMRGC